MSGKVSRWRKMRREAEALWSGTIVGSPATLSRAHKFAHFWVLVWKSFTRNRCPVQAAALAYGSLLALIPMLAVVVSVTSSILKNEGEERIDNFVVKLVSDLVPPGAFSPDEEETNAPNAAVTNAVPTSTTAALTNLGPAEVGSTNTTGESATNIAALNHSAKGTNAQANLAQDKRVLKARRVI